LSIFETFFQTKKIFQDSFSILKLKFKFKIQGRPWSDASAQRVAAAATNI
jgi:hypothetical protein